MISSMNKPGRQALPRRQAIVGVLAALGSIGGCLTEQRGRIDVWVGEDVYAWPTAVAIRTDDGEPGGGAERGVALAGAINETLSFTLTLSARQAPVRSFTVRTTALQGGGAVIPANAISVYRVHQVEPPRIPGWHLRSITPQGRVSRVPDVLVPVDAPRNGLPVNLSDGESVTLWVDVNIPKGSTPGTYSGSIAAEATGRTVASIDVSLTVWPFVLPDSGEVVVFADLDHGLLFGHHVSLEGRPVAVTKEWGRHPAAAQLDDLLTTTMRLLHSHRVTPLLSRLAPVARVDSDGNVEVAWEDYDRVVTAFLDGRRFVDRQPLPLWQVPFNDEFPPAPEYGAQLSPTYSRLAGQYLAECARHFDQRGWLERSFVGLPGAVPGTPDAYATVRHFGRIVRRADQRLRTLAALCPQDMSAYGWEGFAWEDISRYVDIWSPPAQLFDPREMSQELMRGKRAFWSLDRPPFSGSLELWAAPADTRVIGWQARAFELEVVRLGLANDWPPAGDRPVTPQMCCDRGAAPLIYPGRFCGMSTPVPSVRLKRLRRSMLDTAYLRLLNEQGLGHIAAALTESLAPRAASDAYDAHFADGRRGGWVQQPELWAAARRIMADEITRSVRSDASPPDSRTVSAARGDALSDMANTVQWRRFMQRTRRLEIVVDGVRVRPRGPSSAGRMEVEVAVTVINRTRVPVSGRLAFESLPLAWEPEEPQVTFPEIAPQKSRRVVLRAIASVMETDAGAVRYLPIVLQASDRQVYRFAARLAYVATTPINKPLRIDGDLSDWPSAVGNVAEDFLLISGQDPEAAHLSQDRATHPTQCFVAGDGQALYLGFNCMLPDDTKLPEAQSNYLSYEDGVPVGDELIEILISPENLGTRSPAEFYHVVVKPYGSSWERGIRTDPPTGARSPWAADIRAAARIHPDRWVAEVRIPLNAFDTRRTSRTVWGINFTRFDLAHQEFSNWSGAAQNVYDPLAAGNLALP